MDTGTGTSRCKHGEVEVVVSKVTSCSKDTFDYVLHARRACPRKITPSASSSMFRAPHGTYDRAHSSRLVGKVSSGRTRPTWRATLFLRGLPFKISLVCSHFLLTIAFPLSPSHLSLALLVRVLVQSLLNTSPPLCKSCRKWKPHPCPKSADASPPTSSCNSVSRCPHLHLHILTLEIRRGGRRRRRKAAGSSSQRSRRCSRRSTCLRVIYFYKN